MEILGMPWSEAKLLNIANKISEVRRVRKMPVSTGDAISARSFEKVPVIVPNTENIPSTYPLGVL
jgi:hypothetical protein